MSGAKETRTAYRLNANKSKLYALAKKYYPEIEPMRKTVFIKYPRVRDYALNFNCGNFRHRLFLSVCGGRPTLGDELTQYLDNGDSLTDWNAHTLTLEELREFGILEAVEK